MLTVCRGFAVLAPEKALEMVQANDVGHQMRVEMDEVVSVNE